MNRVKRYILKVLITVALMLNHYRLEASIIALPFGFLSELLFLILVIKLASDLHLSGCLTEASSYIMRKFVDGNNEGLNF